MSVNPFPTADYEFGLCLTHDVDRPYKGLPSVFYAVAKQDPRHLTALLPTVNPWWQFEEIMALEDELGVRSAFYFLQERHILERPPREWLDPTYWIEHIGRYNPQSADITSLIESLDDGGWEVGLHGSLGTHHDTERLRAEKTTIEDILGHDIVGGRQHHLRDDPPDTWREYADMGLSYDASFGSTEHVGFQSGYDLLQPFDDFLVFPLTVMDTVLAANTDGILEARKRLHDLLETAREHNAVVTALWHPRNFSRTDYPGHRDLYRYLVETALEMGAWVGPPAHLTHQFSPGDRTDIETTSGQDTPPSDSLRKPIRSREKEGKKPR